MSLRETPMTRWYWSKIGGTLVEEFPAVERIDTCGQRLIDGIIILDGEKKIAKASEVTLTGKNIVVVQTKRGRLGMYLMGQALFSPLLMVRFGPASITSVALCERTDTVLAPLLERYPNVKVVVYPGDDAT
jgi:hypothetical protein